MRALIDALVFATAALGLVVAGRGMVPVMPPLAELQRRGDPRPDGTNGGRRGIARLLDGPGARRRPADLALLGLDPDRWRHHRLLQSAAAGVAPAVVWPIGAHFMGRPVRPLVVGAIVLGGAGARWVWAAADLSRRADRFRRVHRHGVGGLLELASVAMAGGAGPGQALRTAADNGDDPCSRRIRAALAAAEAARVSPFDTLLDLGRALNVPELTETAAALALADRKGAPVRKTLDHKAESVVLRLMREEEAAAESRSVTMSLPSVLMLAGFLLFLLYPFLAALVATTR